MSAVHNGLPPQTHALSTFLKLTPKSLDFNVMILPVTLPCFQKRLRSLPIALHCTFTYSLNFK